MGGRLMFHALMRLGRYDDALGALQESIGIKRDLVRVDPENTTWQLELSLVLQRLGDDQVMLQKPADALGPYGETLVIRKALVTKDPSNSLWQRHIVAAFTALAYAHFALGDRKGAIQDLDEAVVISSLYPAVTVILARLFLKEHFTRWRFVGLLAALAAVPMIASG